MTDALPPGAKDVLARGEWCHLAAATSFGPHVTPVVFAVDGGRLWMTTSRGSAKARAWRRDPRTAGLVRHGSRALAFRGRIRTYDALDPFAWPSIAIRSPRLGKAAMRFSVKNARFFFGYAVDAARVPLAWAPPGRVFCSVELEAGRLLDLEGGKIVDGWGPWDLSLTPARAYAEPPSPDGGRLAPPGDTLSAVATSGSAVLSTQLEGPDGPTLTVVPAGWSEERSRFLCRVPVAFAELTGASTGTKTALTADRSSSWRAADMTGLLIRGDAEVFVRGRTRTGAAALRHRISSGEALFRIAPARIVWWKGWSSGTVTPPSTSRARSSPGRPAKRAAAGSAR